MVVGRLLGLLRCLGLGKTAEFTWVHPWGLVPSACSFAVVIDTWEDHRGRVRAWGV